MGMHNSKTETNDENLHNDCSNQHLPIGGYEKLPLVSLETAVEPLVSLLPSVQTYVQLVKRKCENPSDGLTTDESASIMLCTVRWQPFDQCLSVVLNSTLRSGDREKLKPWFLYLKLLLTALSRLPASHQTVYRGIKCDVSRFYPKGKTITWWDLVLCMKSLDLLQSEGYLGRKAGQTILTIESRSCRDISKHSFYPTTDMILLLPGTQFQVVHCLKQKGKLFWIQLKEIQSPFVLLQSVSVVSQLSQDPIHVDASSLHTKSPPTDTYHHSQKLEQLIAQHPRNSPIYLRLEQVTNNDVKMIVEQAVFGKRCTELWLCNAQLTSQNALLLSNSLYNNQTLTKLNLNDNFIRDRGVHALARILSLNNTKLRELFLARNSITSEGAQYLAEMLYTNITLTNLSLLGNRIDDSGIKSMSHVLSYYNSTLECLYLSGNDLMTDRSIDYLIDMLKYNQTLKKLYLFNCNLSESAKRRLLSEAQPKKHLTIYM
ncbi:unnamed protein product [Adineta ricciae]|uniref:NAD(P)(+)--arginine ADP-ribosyltransferase n=1 Tax=Adineta ricciae TaxID=249248 RepID=A0A814D732_ADIRI|nr:unnamed protein product [Adineta ricciae]